MTQLKWQEDTLVPAIFGDEPKMAIGNDVDLSTDPLDLNGVGVVLLDFPLYKDGRAFSQAQHLRHAGFAGDIRAVGALFHDQIPLAIRCGFTSFDLAADINVDKVMVSIQRFVGSYQGASVGRPLWERRG